MLYIVSMICSEEVREGRNESHLILLATHSFMSAVEYVNKKVSWEPAYDDEFVNKQVHTIYHNEHCFGTVKRSKKDGVLLSTTLYTVRKISDNDIKD